MKKKKKKESMQAFVARRNAMEHPDTLGAGAAKRKRLGPKNKVHTVMSEFKRGTLHSGGGGIVKNPKQAIAIGLSEAGLSKKKKKRKKP